MGRSEQKSADEVVKEFNRFWENQPALYREYAVDDDDELELKLSGPVIVMGMVRTETGIQLRLDAGGNGVGKGMNAEVFDYNHEQRQGGGKTAIGWTSETTGKKYVRTFSRVATD